MKFAVHIFPTDESISVPELAQEAEARGLESVWLPEHTHIPTSRESEWYRGRELPREYLRTLDPFIALTAAAAVTDTIKIATGICLVAQHDPITLAKRIATLDHVSDGRFLFGVGLGWNLEEMRDHGVDPKTRRSEVREKILAIKGLWTEDEFGFDGKFVKFEKSWQWPKPIQKPGPPVIMGGRGTEKAFRHIAEYADGWLPDLNMMRKDAFGDIIKQLADVCVAADRDPAEVKISAQGIGADPEQIQHMVELGVERSVYLLPTAGRDATLAELDKFQNAIETSGVEMTR